MTHKIASKIFYGWWIVLVSFLCTMIWSGCSTYAFSLFVRPLHADFGWNRAGIMAAFTLMLATAGLGSPFVGKLTDRHGPKRVILIGAAVMGLGFILLTQINSLFYFYCCYVFIGVGMAGMGQVPFTTVVSNWFREQRGLAIGIMASGIGVGGLVLAPLVGGYLIPYFGWRIAYLTLGLLTWGIVIPFVSMVFKSKPADMGLYPNGQKPQVPGHMPDTSIPAHAGLTLKQAFFTSAFWLVGISFFVSQFSVMGTIQNQAPHFQDIGFPLATAAAALGGIGFITAFSKVAFGWLCDRMKPKYACTIGIALQVGGTFILMKIEPTSPLTLLWFYVIVFGLGAGHWLPVVSMIVSRNFGLASYGAIFGVMFMFLTLGASLGPFAAGYLYDGTHTYLLAFSIFIGLYLIAFLAILGVHRPERKPCSGTIADW